MKYIAHLGRQTNIAIAELESLAGPENIKPISEDACFVGTDLSFDRIGSSIKLSEVITTLDGVSNFETAMKQASPFVVSHAAKLTGKLKLGISVFGIKETPRKIGASGLQLKKQLKNAGVSVRLIPNKQATLNAAQILNNKLTSLNGFELNLIFDAPNNKVHLTRTIAVQDIDEYARRDREKPARDALVGMLPPKLAQTLINLTGATKDDTVLDPFCGSGTVLMEASTMGIASVGTDISPAMIRASEQNMAWLTHNKDEPNYVIAKGDATTFEWPKTITIVAGETYLGPALNALPDPSKLESIIHEVNATHVAFLKNLALQIPSGTRVCLAVPAWSVKKGEFKDLHLLDDLEKLGYNAFQFRNVSNNLVYHRDNQLVARRILTLIRK